MAPLHIIIVGAGIAGLTAAIGLRKTGQHKITLLEKSSFHQEAGAAIHLSPNCTRILLRLGFDAKDHGGNACVGFAQYFGNGDVKHKVQMAPLVEKAGSPFDLIHRADLHDGLKKLAFAADGEGPVPELLLGCRIQSIDASAAAVTLEDGRTFTGDLIIGSDGTHALSRQHVDSSIRPRPYGRSCYRWLVPTSTLRGDPEVASFIENDGWFQEISDESMRLIMYPCRGNTMMNVAAFISDDQGKCTLVEFKGTVMVEHWLI
jgi:salicylate hydroxylase